MREFIQKMREKSKKDLKRVGIGKKEKQEQPKNIAEVIKPKEEKTEQEEKTEPEEKVEQERYKAGDIIKYAKELICEVIDEEGNNIHCTTIAEAEILSRLIELRLYFMEK